jgi:uncharacterized coiled-coil protein SlyX
MVEAVACALCNGWTASLSFPHPVLLLVANAKLAEANEKLTAVRAKVADLNERLRQLEQQYAAAVADQDAAVAQNEACQRKLGLANRLIAALASGAPGCCGLQHTSPTSA